MRINCKKYLLELFSLKFYYRKYSQLSSRPSYFHAPLLLPSLIKNLPSSFRDFARFRQINRLPSSIISYSGELPAISLLIVVAQKDFKNLELCIDQVLKHSLNPISKIEIVVPESDLASCMQILEQIQFQIPISLFNEDEVINVQLRAEMKSKLQHKYGWALQQLLTLEMVMRSDCCGVLTIDADTFVLRDQVWLNEKFTQVLFQSPEFHPPYYKIINKVFPQIDLISYSHVTHHMLFQPELLRELFTDSDYIDSTEIMIQVLESFDKLQESPFCIEFEPYAQFLHDSHQNRFELRRFSNSNFSTKEDCVIITELIQKFDNHNLYNSINFHSWNN